MAADAPSNPQHRDIGISSIFEIGCGSIFDATVTVVVGTSTAGKSINGCIFFISIAGLAGGLGKTVMRAVSFFGA